ncbi:hypothetical protein [Methylosinus sp. H3A]|uniref:hypothetical protein n=1 Tax=Methylosinus sp. H3A TaxID=2785786 RepID=UPI001FEEC824|nr:hypothetical protein [Methylosinus sp. H3A]
MTNAEEILWRSLRGSALAGCVNRVTMSSASTMISSSAAEIFRWSGFGRRSQIVADPHPTRLRRATFSRKREKGEHEDRRAALPSPAGGRRENTEGLDNV